LGWPRRKEANRVTYRVGPEKRPSTVADRTSMGGKKKQQKLEGSQTPKQPGADREDAGYERRGGGGKIIPKKKK